MLTKSQDDALQLICHWLDVGGRLFRLGGPAGSGKSYLIPLVVDVVGDEKCILMTPTGKAANNLIKAGMTAKTIHSAIYYVQDNISEDDDSEIPVTELTGPKYVKKPDDAFKNIDLFIIDEGSMVGGKLLSDILSFGVPVLMVGDPHQLAPVNDTSVFSKCDFYLTEIVRQAQDSPIIWLSQQALQGRLPQGAAGSVWVRREKPTIDEMLYADIILVDQNKIRDSVNKLLRPKYIEDCSSIIAEGDHLICRTNDARNHSTLGFPQTNGTMGVVSEILHADKKAVEVQLDGGDMGMFKLMGALAPTQKSTKKIPTLLEYSYAITVHLSQGSEWNKVLYSMKQLPNKRALYTAITRAKESLLVTLE